MKRRIGIHRLSSIRRIESIDFFLGEVRDKTNDQFSSGFLG